MISVVKPNNLILSYLLTLYTAKNRCIALYTDTRCVTALHSYTAPNNTIQLYSYTAIQRYDSLSVAYTLYNLYNTPLGKPGGRAPPPGGGPHGGPAPLSTSAVLNPARERKSDERAEQRPRLRAARQRVSKSTTSGERSCCLVTLLKCSVRLAHATAAALPIAYTTSIRIEPLAATLLRLAASSEALYL